MMVVVKKIADPLQNACNLMSKIGMHIHNNINRIACKIEYSKIDEVIKYIYNIAGRNIIFPFFILRVVIILLNYNIVYKGKIDFALFINITLHRFDGSYTKKLLTS